MTTENTPDNKQEKQPKKINKQKLSLIIVVACMIVAVAVAIGVSAYFLSRNNREITISFQLDGDQLDSIKVKWGEIPQLPQLEQDGCEFKGWYTEDGKLVDEAFWQSYNYMDDLKLHPVWDITEPVMVSYDAKGGKAVDSMIVPRGYSRTVAGQTEREGFYLLGWCFDDQCLSTYYPGYVINEDITLYAKWIPKEINQDAVSDVVYNTMGGDELEKVTQQQGEAISLPTIHRLGYAFAGWYSDSEYRYPVETGVLVTASCTIYAKWEERSPVTITFVTPEGSPAMEAKEIVFDTVVTSFGATTPKWEGYRFDGYFLDRQYISRVEFPFNATEDRAVYLKFTSLDIAQADVTFFLYRENEQSFTQVERLNEGDSIQNWTPQRDGYIFGGWYVDEQFEHDFDFAHTTARDGLIIYAKWIVQSEYGDANLLYEPSEDGKYLIVVGEVNRSTDVVVIGDTYDGLPIKEIAERVFYGRAFTSITFGANIQTIGEQAFGSCNVVKSITIPVGVKTISDSAFAGCQSLQSVSIDGIAVIGANAFKDCVRLEEVNAPNVSAVNANAFYGCVALSAVDIIYVKELGTRAFYGCEKLSSISLSGGTLDNIPTECFYGCAKLSKISLPKSVKTLNYYAFAGTGLETFSTNGITKIYRWAFDGVSSLRRFTIDSDLQELQMFAMPGVTGLEQFVVNGNDNFSVKNNSLYNKEGTKLIQYAGTGESFTIGKEVTSIDLFAFLSATHLKNVYVDKDNSNFASVDGVLYTKNTKTLLWYPAGREETSYTVASGVQTIGTAAFAAVAALDRVELPSSVTALDVWAFYLMDAITTISVPEGLDVDTDEESFTCAVYDCPNVEIEHRS